ncbi:MAG: hypothetical protein R3F37_03155 [Candidatus Competibacteraceae bacterium]
MTGIELALLEISASFHDIGKIGVPDHILLKPAKLEQDEMATDESARGNRRTHPVRLICRESIKSQRRFAIITNTSMGAVIRMALLEQLFR